MKRQRRFKPVPLYEKLTEYQVALFSVNQHNYPGASIEAYLKRYYPFGDTLTHALGYVAKINTRDVERLEKEENSPTTRPPRISASRGWRSITRMSCTA